MLFNQYMNLQEEYEYFYEQKTFYHSEKEEGERKNRGRIVLRIENNTCTIMVSLRNGTCSVNDIFFNTRTFDLYQVYKMHDMQCTHIHDDNNQYDTFYIICIKRR